MTPAVLIFILSLAVAIANDAPLWAQLGLLGATGVLLFAGAYEPTDEGN